jgi:hypothetical protein
VGDNNAPDDWRVQNGPGFIGHRRFPSQQVNGCFVGRNDWKFQVITPSLSVPAITLITPSHKGSTFVTMLAALRRSGLPLRFPRHRLYATVSNPQTLVEKIVQKYAVDLAPGTKVHSGDYVMIKPEHV